MTSEEMATLDAWCNYGFRLLEKIPRDKPEYMIALLALQKLTRRRVA